MQRWSVCSQPGCPTYVPQGQSRCDEHSRHADRRRGTAAERGYTGRGHKGFRALVLERDPICVICRLATATVADHYPVSRRDLVESGADPNDPVHGRGLCSSCHGRETAKHQPGGWNSRDED